MLEAAAEHAPLEILVPQRTLGNDLRAIKIVWQRDIIRFWGDKPRIFASLGQPFLYMFVMGTGLSTMVPPQAGLWLPTFLFPGVLAFSVSARTREFGVRLAIGSAPRRLLASVLTEGVQIAAIGIAAGAAGGFVLARMATRFITGVQLPGLLPVVGATAVLMAAAIVASLMPAARASRVDVLQALRSE